MRGCTRLSDNSRSLTFVSESPSANSSGEVAVSLATAVDNAPAATVLLLLFCASTPPYSATLACEGERGERTSLCPFDNCE